jgi:Phosphotransferase enzyme family
MEASELGLSSAASVVSVAIAIATQYLDSDPVFAKECAMQGEFSRTVDIAMKDGANYVVQLRGESVHEEKAEQAHGILGHLVPVPIRIIREGETVPYSYIMTRCPGSTWLTRDEEGWAREFHIKVAAQIGEMIGRCAGYKSGHDPINTFIAPRLEMYLAWDEPLIVPFKGLIRTLLDRVNHLSKLPICWTHWDINMMNIMVDDDATVTGILDWEEAYWLPLGMNTGRISELAAYNQRGVMVKRSYSDDMEAAFWRSFFEAAPTEARGLVQEIQLAKDIGLIMLTFHDGSVRPHPSQVGVLQDSMAYYRVPDLSGT